MASATRFRLAIPRTILEEMIAHARAESPAECCGLLAGTGTVVTHRHPLVNALASPTEFLSEPRSMFAADRRMKADGAELLAVYHSHPTSEPIPSRKDLERHWPGEKVLCVIVGLSGGPPEVRAWRLFGASYEPVEWSND